MPALLVGCGGTRPATAPAPPEAAGGLERTVGSILERYPADVEAALWLERLPGGPVYRRVADTPLPSASAIKVAYMVELFAAHPDLDAPLAGADAVLDAPGHPALAPFDDATRAEIRRALRGASVRRLARTMIRGDGVSNSVYNAAANVVTAVLGGPARLTRLLHDREASWGGLQVRRYMLAARHVTGDNEATAAALATVLRGVATGTVPDLDPALYRPMRDILAVDTRPDGARGAGRHFFKSGSLDTDPPVRILSGWWESGERKLLYVVIVSRPGSGDESPQAAGDELARLAEELRAALLEAATEG